MRYFFTGLGLLVCTGCAGPRMLARPQLVTGPVDYIYFVDQAVPRDSRIIKCDIQSDNRVACSRQYDLAPRVFDQPDETTRTGF